MDAHGGWIVAAPDYVRFLSALFDDFDASPLLSRQSIQNMVRVNDATNENYGRGWDVFEEGGQMVYGHSGSIPGTLTQTRWAEPGIAFAAFINTRKNMADLELEDPTVIPDHDLFESVGIVNRTRSAPPSPSRGFRSWPTAPEPEAASGVPMSVCSTVRPSTNQVKVRVEMPGLAVDRDLELAPGEHLVMNDIVSVLGLSGSGSLRIFSFEPLTVASRTYNSSDEGTFGQFLGGVTGPGGLVNGDSAVLMHLREDDAARSNIGILNAGRREARVQIVLYDGAGAEVGRANRTVDPRRIKQLNRPFETIGGRTDINPGYAVITVLDGEEVVVYGSVVDAGTNDPTTIPMKDGAGATSGPRRGRGARRRGRKAASGGPISVCSISGPKRPKPASSSTRRADRISP